jgi:hypothetical protein
VVAATTENIALQRTSDVLVPFPCAEPSLAERIASLVDFRVGGIKNSPVYDGRVMVGYFNPFGFIDFNRFAATNAQRPCLPGCVSADVLFVGQDAHDLRLTPKTGDVFCQHLKGKLFVLCRRGVFVGVETGGNLGKALAVRRQLEDQAYRRGGRFVNFQTIAYLPKPERAVLNNVFPAQSP